MELLLSALLSTVSHMANSAPNVKSGGLDDDDLDRLFRALADPTRRAMLRRLSRGSMTIGELAEPFDMSKPSITKHVKVLERASLLSRHVDGRVHHCHLSPRPLSDVAQWLQYYESFWNEKLDDLETYLSAENPDD